MGKAVLISIQPKWCEKIANGEKTVEVRKSRPKLETPFKCYIYCTYGQGLIQRSDACFPNVLLDLKAEESKMWGNCCNGKVIGEFVCDEIRDFKVLENGDIQDYYYADLDYSCLDASEIGEYIGTGRVGYSWGISNLVIYDKPKLLSEFGVKRPPQSWCYVEELTTV